MFLPDVKFYRKPFLRLNLQNTKDVHFRGKNGSHTHSVHQGVPQKRSKVPVTKMAKLTIRENEALAIRFWKFHSFLVTSSSVYKCVYSFLGFTLEPGSVEGPAHEECTQPVELLTNETPVRFIVTPVRFIVSPIDGHEVVKFLVKFKALQ